MRRRRRRFRPVIVLAALRDAQGNIVAEAVTTYLVEVPPRRW
jgi:hypothetical protein